MEGNGEGYAHQWYSLAPSSLAPGNYSHQITSLQQVIPAMENQVSQSHITGNQLRNIVVPAENQVSQSHVTENHLWNIGVAAENQVSGSHITGNQLWQIPSLRNPFYQNTTLPQNPTQSHQRIYSPSNPPPSRQCHDQFFGNSFFTYTSSTNANSIPSSSFESQVFTDLESRMGGLRIDSAVRGPTVAYPRHNGAQFSVNLANLGLPQFNSSSSFANHHYGNMANGGSNLVPATNEYATSGSNFNNFSQHGSQFIDEYQYSAAPRIRLDLGSQHNGGRSINEFLPMNPSSNALSSSSWYNHNAVRARQPARYSSMEELRGRVCSVAKDQHDCHFLLDKVVERNPMDIEMILLEVKDELHELMVHQFGNYLIQKLIEVLNEQQITLLIRSVVSREQRLFRICENVHGTRLMQKLLDPTDVSPRKSLTSERKFLPRNVPPRPPLTPEQQFLLASALQKFAVSLSKSLNGHHVIQRCLQKFSNDYTKELVEEIAENCLDLATDKSGCCVLQQCIVHAKEEQKWRLIADIATNALILSEHSYGNYVVQYVLGMKIPQVTTNIIAQLAGNYFTLSQGKFGSNVVEKCMKGSEEEQCHSIITEIIRHPDILDLMLHPYGNYVIQSAWKISQGRPIRQSLLHLVQKNFLFLQSHIYGKRVLAAVRGNKNHA